MGIGSSSMCTFCGKFEESLEHIFIVKLPPAFNLKFNGMAKKKFYH